MSQKIIHASQLRRQIEEKAYAYGAPEAVGTLLSEYVIELLRDASQHNQQHYGKEQEKQLV